MRILLVEDDLKIASAVKRGLENEGMVIAVENDGKAGYDRALYDTFDVIILDIMLPGMNGFLVCRELRRMKIWTPLLMLTAKDGEYDEAEALDTGADDYLTKPFSFMVLVARIRALTRRINHTGPATEYSAGDLVLNPSSHRCHRGEVEINLTTREFAVLEFLMINADNVVSKTEVLENVWDFAYDGDVNIVEVYIRNLRQKIDLPFEKVSIKTIRGAGYRFEGGGG